jgi:trehalose 6-phosphate synthase
MGLANLCGYPEAAATGGTCQKKMREHKEPMSNQMTSADADLQCRIDALRDADFAIRAATPRDDASPAGQEPGKLRGPRGRPPPSKVTDLLHRQVALAKPETRGRLIVVSNRVALPNDVRAGGLASALKGTLADHGGVWFGWSGQISAQPRFDVRSDPMYPIEYATVDLTREDYDEYYAGFANRVLWPLLHYRLLLLDFSRQTLAAYRRVSTQFADHLVDLIRPDDTVWVHDYHLIPLGAALRSRGVDARMGFFLHTPMAPPELMMSLPHHRDLMATFAAYDLVGFQTDADRRAFAEYCERALHARVDRDTIHVDRHALRVGTFPIGIDTAQLQALGERAATASAPRHLRESIGPRTLLAGVDRLDYSKGLPERFQAFGRLLREHPELQRQVMLLQIAPPSRGDVPEYRELRGKLEGIAGAINSRYSEPDWTPIRYLNKSYQQARLAGIYRCARVGLVTPLRDGMNLVAKEYIAAQNPQDPGVLVLSRFAGAAHELDEALLVNPFDADQVVEAMRQALLMPLGERKRRWRRMFEHLREHDVIAWRRDFLAALADCPAQHGNALALQQAVQHDGA